MAMAATIAANMIAASRVAANVRARYAGYDTDILYNTDDDITSSATDEELGIETITRTTLGHPVLKEDRTVYGIPKAETWWEVFQKMWIPNFGYRGRRRK